VPQVAKKYTLTSSRKVPDILVQL